MMRSTILALLLLVAPLLAGPARSQSSYPGNADFAIRGMPVELMLQSGAVVRLHDVSFEVRSARRATERVRRAVTILGPDARDAGRMVVPYDGFRRLNGIDARIVDSDGQTVRRMRKDELQDFSAISGFSLYEDSRVRVADLRHDQYPYTVVVEYEIDHRGFLNWPRWYPLDSPASVEWARFSISAPADVAVRYHITGDLPEPVVSTSNARQHYEWVAEKIVYQKAEPLGPPVWKQYPSVLAAPDQFEIGGHAGRMDTWRDFGLWYWQLSEGRDRLPEQVASDVHAIRAEAENERDLVRRLYRYMQDGTRYVSVQLGIGGWQPFDAAYVVEHGYGDCKALSNYMFALLKEAGITSYPTLIQSERYPDRLVPDFPSNQFNHAILMVPLTEEADTLWLETTDATAPFGHIGASNEGRWALAVGPAGGELVRTPSSAPERNYQHRVGTVALDILGGARVAVETRYGGNQQDRIRPLARASSNDRQDWIRHALGLADYRVVAADFDAIGIRADEVGLPVELSVPRFATVAGSRIFFQPNLMERWQSIPEEVERRTQDVVVAPYRYLDVDSIRYDLPANVRIEARPEDVVLEESFGSYQLVIDVDDEGGLTFIRRLEIQDVVLPPEAYDAYRAFAAAVVRADGSQIVLVRE